MKDADVIFDAVVRDARGPIPWAQISRPEPPPDGLAPPADPIIIAEEPNVPILAVAHGHEGNGGHQVRPVDTAIDRDLEQMVGELFVAHPGTTVGVTGGESLAAFQQDGS